MCCMGLDVPLRASGVGNRFHVPHLMARLLASPSYEHTRIANLGIVTTWALAGVLCPGVCVEGLWRSCSPTKAFISSGLVFIHLWVCGLGAVSGSEPFYSSVGLVLSVSARCIFTVKRACSGKSTGNRYAASISTRSSIRTHLRAIVNTLRTHWLHRTVLL